MRKFLIIFLCLFMITGCMEKETTVENKEVDIKGNWMLDETKNDMSVFDDMDKYPGFNEWGAAMNVSDKEISLYIGALSYSGTYSKQDNVIHSELTGDIDNSLNQWDFYIVDDNCLEMRFGDMNIYWIKGEINVG